VQEGARKVQEGKVQEGIILKQNKAK
jgi:hypothetical protein